jgi:flagellar biosynthesis protein FliP
MNPSALPLLADSLKGTQVSTVFEIIFLLTVLSLGPLILITLTSFTRIVIVLSFVRQALGTQQAPSNQIVIALALFISLYVMAPVWQRIEADAVTPYLNKKITAETAIAQAWTPLRGFVLKQTHQADVAIFLRGEKEKTLDIKDAPATALIPAFMISELKTAFQMAFFIYVPFLIFDLVVASVLMSMGMMFLPPALVSLPFKLALFVLVDGWNLLVTSLIRSFE